MQINKKTLDKKCHFCVSDATNVYSFLLSTVPDDPEGFLFHEYFKEPIFTCNKHILSCKGFTLNGEELD